MSRNTTDKIVSDKLILRHVLLCSLDATRAEQQTGRREPLADFSSYTLLSYVKTHKDEMSLVIRGTLILFSLRNMKAHDGNIIHPQTLGIFQSDCITSLHSISGLPVPTRCLQPRWSFHSTPKLTTRVNTSRYWQERAANQEPDPGVAAGFLLHWGPCLFNWLWHKGVGVTHPCADKMLEYKKAPEAGRGGARV